MDIYFSHKIAAPQKRNQGKIVKQVYSIAKELVQVDEL
jgi:hypothetical protein